MPNPATVLAFWLNELRPRDWYNATPALDATIRTRFGSLWQDARDGLLNDWQSDANGTLAYIILTDQFPRNMFRDEPEAFATDALARAAAERALAAGYDMAVSEPGRQFFYLPFMHSECRSDQERGVALIQTRLPDTGDASMIHAKAHREVIRRFGRFPTRNAALCRPSTAAEMDYLDHGGYGAVLRGIETRHAHSA